MPILPAGWSAEGSPSPASSAPAVQAVPSSAVSTPVAAESSADGEDVTEIEEKAIVLNLKDDADLLHEFHGESVELLQNIEQGVLVLEENPTDANTINSIFRAFHTFKGGAGFLHLHALQNLAHDLESLLDAARQSKLQITSPIIDIILAGSDALKHYTAAIGEQIKGVNAGQPIVVPTSRIILRVKAVLNGDPPPEVTETAPAAAFNAPVEVVSHYNKECVSETVEFPKNEETKLVVPVAPASSKSAAGKTLAKQDPLVTRPVGGQKSVTESASGFVKLETWTLDALVDLVGELVIGSRRRFGFALGFALFLFKESLCLPTSLFWTNLSRRRFCWRSNRPCFSNFGRWIGHFYGRRQRKSRTSAALGSSLGSDSSTPPRLAVAIGPLVVHSDVHSSRANWHRWNWFHVYCYTLFSSTRKKQSTD
jgi:chemotaxis protein histidine kinase CheA